MIFPNKQKNFLKKSVAIVLLAVTLSFSPVQTKQADALWGEVMQQMLKQVLEYINDNIQHIIVGALKQTAAKMINEQIANLISGSSSQDSKIIGNYKDFLYTEPLEQTKLFMNDYLTQMVSGRGSASSYIPNPGFGGGAGGGYSTQLVQMARRATIEPVKKKLDTTFDPSNAIKITGDNVDLSGFSKFTDSDGINNPLTFEAAAKDAFNNRMAIEQEAARMEGMVGKGMRSTRSGDTITTPGAIIADTMVNALDIGNKIIAGAQGMPEVITAIVTQVVTQTIETGIGKAAENVQRGGGSSNWGNGGQSQGSETSNWVNPDTGKPFGQ